MRSVKIAITTGKYSSYGSCANLLDLLVNVGITTAGSYIMMSKHPNYILGFIERMRGNES